MLANKALSAAGSTGITFVGVTSAQFSSTGTITVTAPTGIQDGDLVVLALSATGTSGDGTISNTDWFPIGLQDAGTADFTFYGHYAASDGSTYSITTTNTATTTYICAAYRNAVVDATSAITLASGGAVTLPSLTAFASQSVLLCCITNRNTGSTATTPTGMSIVASEVGATRASAFLFSQSGISAGATGTRSSTISAGNAVGQSVVLRPKAGPYTSTFTYTGNTGTVSSVTVNKPGNTVSGDLLIAFMGMTTSTARTWTQPSGWTEVADQNATPNVAVSYKVAGGSEPASYTFTPSAGSVLYCVIVKISNGTYDTIGTFGTTTTSPLVAPSITLSSGPSLLLAFYLTSNASTDTLAIPTDMSLINYFKVSTVTPIALLAYQTLSAGSTGTRSSATNSTARNAAIMVGVKP